MFPSHIKDWKKLESNIKKLESITLQAFFIENNREKKKAYISKHLFNPENKALWLLKGITLKHHRD